MKKVLFIMLIMSSISSFSQNKSELIAAERAKIDSAIAVINQAKQAIEAIKMSNDSINILNPATLKTKKAALMMAEKDSNICYYLNFGAKSLIVSEMQLKIKIGESWYFLTPFENGFYLKTFEEMTTVNTLKLR